MNMVLSGSQSRRRIPILFSLLVMALAIILIIIIVIQQQHISDLRMQLQNPTNNNPIVDNPINVTTDTTKYTYGQPIRIHGMVSNAKTTNTTVTLQVSALNFKDSTPIYRVSVPITDTGYYSDSGLRLERQREYIVNAVAVIGNGESKVDQKGQYKTVSAITVLDNNTAANPNHAFTFFNVYEPFYSRQAYFMYGTFASISVLMLVILLDVKKATYVIEILRFACITTIVTFPILGFFQLI